MTKLIDLEAHFLTQSFVDCFDNRNKIRNERNYEKLIDLGDKRLEEMDEAGICMQVLSLYQPPHIQGLESSVAINLARNTNEELSKAVEKHPDRLVGLAAIPVQCPDEAAEELERAILKLGLKGVCITSNARDEYFDDPKYWTIFETAEKLDVPIYIHPTNPSAVIAGAYAGYEMLRGPLHGFYSEVSLHIMRLIYSGLFDKYPGLKMIVGHMGEGLPFWLPRLDIGWPWKTNERPSIEKKPSEYIKKNFTITTSGMFFPPALICSYLALGADRIAFAVDYPPERNSLAVDFIEAAPICDIDKEKICHSNAEVIFKL